MLFVGDSQIRELDAEIEMTHLRRVTFVRLLTS